MAGYETDPTGDADGIDICDITRVDVLVSYNSHPTDDEITLKITLAEDLYFNSSNTGWYDYNFLVDTSLTTNSNTSELADTDYEYFAHMDRRYLAGTWYNHTYLMATRYYLTNDGSAKTMGNFWWNPNTDTWEGSDPVIDFAVISGNTVSWDVTGAIFREQPIGTGYVVQGVARTSFGLNVKDQATESGWVDEFDNLCEYPYTNTSGTPSLPFPGFEFLISFSAIGFVATAVFIIRRRK